MKKLIRITSGVLWIFLLLALIGLVIFERSLTDCINKKFPDKTIQQPDPLIDHDCPGELPMPPL